MKATGLLNGLQVLDLTDEKGSFCSRLLADFGARVIKVEKPEGDASRWIGPFWKNVPHPEKSLFFYYNNAGKLGITLNLENSEGQKIFRRLIKRADVIIESFSHGYLESLGLDYETLSKINPRLIWASITGFGRSGSYKDYKACDIVASAMGGQMSLCGAPDTPPLKPYGQQTYYLSSLYACLGIMLALRERKYSGLGQHIDISMQEAVAASIESIIVHYFGEGTVAKRRGRIQWDSSFCTLPCKDGYISISLLLGWSTLVEWLDSEGMASDLKGQEWQEEEYRIQHIEHIIEILGRWTRTHTRAELCELAQLMHLPWAPVATPTEVLNSPQLRARRFFVSLAHPELNAFLTYPGAPYKSEYSLHSIRTPAPSIGEHNAYIYRELGFSQDELESLSSEKVI